MSLASLSDPSLTIIFATSPLGLGHLRVTDALYHGLPKTASPILFGTQAPTASFFYRFVSNHRATRKIMELLQVPPLDKPVATIGRKFLASQTEPLYQELKVILRERFIVPKTVLFVAAHAVHGHPLGAIKQRLSREMGVTVLLVIQVTDDSPQAIWYVPDADIIFVPSEYTKAKLLAYAKKAHLPLVPIVVIAYPISPLLTEHLSEQEFENRLDQTNPNSHVSIHISVPVPGAAVGTTFMTNYIKALHQASHRFVFHVVSREAGYTKSFLKTMSQLPQVKLYTSTHERATVDNYERVFMERNISLDITKPSEQAFKALANPRQRGGSILLLTIPVGGQEYDNLHFLRNHGLMPGQQDTQLLWHMAEKQATIAHTDIVKKAHHWRALLLPVDPLSASAFTVWCLKEQLFETMMYYVRKEQGQEIESNGVEQFWREVTNLLEKDKGAHS